MSLTETWRSSPMMNLKKRLETQWICEHDGCKQSNFSNRWACRLCNYPRHGMTLSVKVGDWYCKECYELNFSSRVNCKRCERPSNAKTTVYKEKSFITVRTG